MSSSVYALALIVLCALITFGERLLPFLVFRNRPVPDVIRYLGRVLPTAVMGTLVVYCLRATSFAAASDYLPPLLASAVTAALHLWRRNTLLSVVAGTACYMLLLRVL